MKKIGKYNYEKSDRKNKKLMVTVNNRKIHFGDVRYQQFKDATGIYKNLDHNDQERRKRYLKRATNIKNKKGELTYKDPESPNYHAVRILWAGN